ncbi:glyoxalase/bleomycin resistance/extradiol dioxygenase family protein [Chitinophaga caeni]|uniref:Glyoxalase/bleomycin resistance/extradiol dioxygenase family protein n=1 Tax=Chitinophaga caeni TaxID=2029983 RepID=A0A291QWK4_9BACT|nr:VOC family protein [Chitinophaga caeni]ATL48338.1 glyoxalase/bleomycin resistance/extradiol dioxygenase family protein [Chitinophaga caeni]
MKIDHLAIWVDDLEGMKEFYTRYFKAIANEKYTNEKKEFQSYFLSFPGSETRLELMSRPTVHSPLTPRGFTKGITNFSMAVGGKNEVDALTERLRSDSFTIEGEPRLTGDGYYESVVLDPEGNHIEITS